jgi:predicted nucleotidyltransferase
MPSSRELVLSRSETLVNALSNLEQVRGILCFGSYAMGTNDDRSDIDLYVICQPQIPSPIDRQAVFLQTVDLEVLNIDYDQPAWENQWCPSNDRLLLKGIQIDIIYNTLIWVQSVVTKVKNLGATSLPELKFRPYTFLGLLENSVILFDPDGILQDIVADLYPFPSGLRQTLITNSLAVITGSLEDLHDYTKRNIGNSAFLFHLWRVIDAMETLLFALNERYSPATKRLEEAYRSLPILPENFLERYNNLLETPLTPSGRLEMMTRLQELVDDILKLVRRYP